MIVFGGRSERAHADTWEFGFDGKPGWNRLNTQGDPPSLFSAQAVYDPVRDRMIVLFGYNAETEAPSQEVWALALKGSPDWTRLSVEGDPPLGGQAIYDAMRDRVLVVAGVPSSRDSLKSGVWALNFEGQSTARWSRLPVPGPSPLVRVQFGLVHDTQRDRLVLFAGGVLRRGSFPEMPYRPLNDTWALSLRDSLEWKKLEPSGDLPYPRLGAFAVYDRSRDRMVIWNGSSAPGYLQAMGDAWSLSFASDLAWAKLPAELHPAPERDAPIYDTGRDRIVTFGGVDYEPGAGSFGSLLALVRALPLAYGREWESLYPTEAIPAGESGQTLTYDPIGKRFILLGGFAPTNTVWIYDLLGNRGWNAVNAAGTGPPQRSGHSAIYDPETRSIVIFGGRTIGAQLNDVWRLSLVDGLVWSPITTSGSAPSPRSQHQAIYDPIGRRMVLFGGFTQGGVSNDVWELSLSDLRWTSIVPAGAPPTVSYTPGALVYDSNRHRALLVGPETWSLDLDHEMRWEQLDASGPAVPRNGAYFDADADRVLAIATFPDSQPWLLDLSPSLAWHVAHVSGNAPVVTGTVGFEPGSAYSFGSSAGYRGTDLWRLELKESPRQISQEFRPGSNETDARLNELSFEEVRPNPSVGSMSLVFTLSVDAPVSVRVFDAAGRMVRTLLDGTSISGRHELTWDGGDEGGRRARAGIYFCVMTAQGRIMERKVVLLSP